MRVPAQSGRFPCCLVCAPDCRSPPTLTVKLFRSLLLCWDPPPRSTTSQPGPPCPPLLPAPQTRQPRSGSIRTHLRGERIREEWGTLTAAAEIRPGTSQEMAWPERLPDAPQWRRHASAPPRQALPLSGALQSGRSADHSPDAPALVGSSCFICLLVSKEESTEGQRVTILRRPMLSQSTGHGFIQQDFTDGQ